MGRNPSTNGRPRNRYRHMERGLEIADRAAESNPRNFDEPGARHHAPFGAFSVPKDTRWNPDLQAVEFGVGIGEYEGVVRVARDVFRRFIDGAVTPVKCLDAYHLQRTRFELITERKLRRRQLADDGNVVISGRDLRERQASQPQPSGLTGIHWAAR
jgi:hypothetical protein